MPGKLVTLIDNQTIAASGSYLSAAFLIPKGHRNFALSWVITGDGTAKFEVVTSLDGDQYTPDLTMPIASGQTKSSGPGADGKDEGQIFLRPCASFKVKCTETGTSDTVTVTARLLSIE